MTDAFLLSRSLASAAAATPDHPAIVDGDRTVSYGELADRAARFASALSGHGVQPGDRVVVCAAKSIETVVAIHGAQWAGAVAVPVDPAAPGAALADVVADAEPSAAVVDARTVRAISGLDVGLVVGAAVDDATRASLDWDAVAAHEPASPVARLADDPAYILYTSGSTGRPKGIVHSHHSGLRFARLAADTYGLGSDDRLASIAPFHFDQSTFELYASVVAGATTVLVPGHLLAFPAEVSKLIASSGATVWYSVPTLLVHLLERGALDRHDLSRLRWVLFGGEVFPTESLGRLMQLLPDARFSNVYGPTEVNQCTFHHLDEPPPAGASIPIGVAWDDTELRLVDDGAVLDGPGRGELQVRTATMMLGYWRRGDLTDERVLVERGDDGIARRWYRTGDVVERDADGLLHFVGRVDRQVKLRGHRVELEGVEAVLSDAPGITRGAVVLVERDGDSSLVGVVEGAEVDVAATLRHLRTRLPAYAVPTELVVLPALPRTTTGKIDANAAAEIVTTTLGGHP